MATKISIRTLTNGEDIIQFHDGAYIGTLTFRKGLFYFSHPIGSSMPGTQYSDGVTLFRTVARDGMLCNDQAITSLGFLGAQNTDWKQLNSQKIPT